MKCMKNGKYSDFLQNIKRNEINELFSVKMPYKYYFKYT